MQGEDAERIWVCGGDLFVEQGMGGSGLFTPWT